MAITGVVYVSGSQNPRLNQPGGMYSVSFNFKGMRLFYSPSGLFPLSLKQDFIEYKDMVKVETEHHLGEDTSYDKLLGRKNINSTVTVTYKGNDGEIRELVLQTKNAEKIKSKIEKKLPK